MIYPTPLRPGDRVALVGPSGPVPPERVEPALDAVKALGLTPILWPSATASHGYLAGEDRQRARDLTDAFLDDSIRGILCPLWVIEIDFRLALLVFAQPVTPCWFRFFLRNIFIHHRFLMARSGFIFGPPDFFRFIHISNRHRRLRRA